ncbi:hypothetical protein PMIN03_004296 [Paraphaeosphaeria minitans]
MIADHSKGLLFGVGSVVAVIALLQNGIGIEQEYLQAFLDNHIPHSSDILRTVQKPAGVIAHQEAVRLEIGSYPSSAPSTYAQAFRLLLRQAGATATVVDVV